MGTLFCLLRFSVKELVPRVFLRMGVKLHIRREYRFVIRWGSDWILCCRMPVFCDFLSSRIILFLCLLYLCDWFFQFWSFQLFLGK